MTVAFLTCFDSCISLSAVRIQKNNDREVEEGVEEEEEEEEGEEEGEKERGRARGTNSNKSMPRR